ncbi:MAG: energy-coupling factor transporter ATPase [Oscillospiraceae bacterium]
MTPILEIQNLSHVYSADTPFERAALRDVSLSIQRGEFVGLIGHTGSGKSTLIQHFNGLLKPTSGRVLFDGEDIWKDVKFTREIRFKVGLVFQYPEHQLFEETVYQDISFGPKNMGLSEEEIRARVERAAQFVGITDAELQKSPFDLSGGQKRRAAIAGVIAMEPDVLILDEPTAGLDPRGRESILQNIRDYQAAQHAAVVMVSHSMEEIASNVDRLLVMNHGQNVMNGTPAEVFSHAEELVEMGLAIPKMTQLFLALKRRGVPVDTSVFSVEQARQALRPLLKGGRGVC